MAYEQYPRPMCMALLNVLNAEEEAERFLKLGYLFDVTLRHLTAIAVSQLQQDFERARPDLECRPTLDYHFRLLTETVRLYRTTNRESFVCTELLDTFWRGERCKPFSRMGSLIDTEIGHHDTMSKRRYSVQRFCGKMLRLRDHTWARGAAGLSKTRCQMFNRYLVPAMETMLERLDFLCRYPLVSVEAVEATDHDGYAHRLRRFMGPFAREEGRLWVSDAAGRQVAGRLYLAHTEGEAIKPALSLYPWAILHHAPDAADAPPEVYYLSQGSDRSEYVDYHTGRVLGLPQPSRRAQAGRIADPDALPHSDLFQADQLDGRRFSQSAWDILKGGATEAGHTGWREQRTIHLLQALAGRPNGRFPFLLSLEHIESRQMAVLVRALTGGRYPLCAASVGQVAEDLRARARCGLGCRGANLRIRQKDRPSGGASAKPIHVVRRGADDQNSRLNGHAPRFLWRRLPQADGPRRRGEPGTEAGASDGNAVSIRNPRTENPRQPDAVGRPTACDGR